MEKKETWERAILKCIKSLGGTAYNKDVYEKIEEYIPLTEKHREIQYKRPTYYHQVRSHIANLVKAGDLIKIEDGLHEITETGLERLDNEGKYIEI